MSPQGPLRLSEAMLEGIISTIPIRKAYMELHRGRKYACVLGAAWIGAGKPFLDRQDISRGLMELWPELGRNSVHPVTGEKTTLEFIIWDLNDKQHWPRIAIALWLEREGY